MRFAITVAAALCVCSLAAHADTVNTYTINAPLSDGGLFNGTFAYDVTFPFLSTLVGSTTNSRFNGTVNGVPFAFGTGVNYSLLEFANNSTVLNLYFPGSNLFGFSGVLCTTASANCGGQSSFIGASVNFLGTTTVVPYVAPSVSVTPEPSSFALLGTGVLGLACVLRKRFV